MRRASPIADWIVALAALSLLRLPSDPSALFGEAMRSVPLMLRWATVSTAIWVAAPIVRGDVQVPFGQIGGEVE